MYLCSNSGIFIATGREKRVKIKSMKKKNLVLVSPMKQGLSSPFILKKKEEFGGRSRAP
jgi:hypothetical protein